MTGFFFPVDRLWPSHGVGIISLVALTVTSLALDGVLLAGSWRWSHVVCAVLTFDLNGFVGVVQAFQKLPFPRPAGSASSRWSLNAWRTR